jgi:hypothetical protein
MFAKKKKEEVEAPGEFVIPADVGPLYVEVGQALEVLGLDQLQFRIDHSNGWIERPRYLTIGNGMGKGLAVAGADTLTVSLALKAWRSDRPKVKIWTELCQMRGASGPPSMADIIECNLVAPDKLAGIREQVKTLLTTSGKTESDHIADLGRAWTAQVREDDLVRRDNARKVGLKVAAATVNESLKRAAVGAMVKKMPVKEFRDLAVKYLSEAMDSEAKRLEKQRTYIKQMTKGATQ